MKLYFINNKDKLKAGNRRLLMLTFAASLAGVVGQTAIAETQTRPKLVVGIVVEDLRNDYINLLREHFTHGGFNRLLRDGVVIANADFGTSLDPTAATALIYTGASPSVNGIPAAEVFDKPTMRGQSIFYDRETMGNYTTNTYSPDALQVTTISDEAMVAGDGVTYAYSIAPDADKAIIMAAHAGSCGMWLDNANEGWATTTYYRDVPTTMNTANRFNPMKSRLDTMAWVPARASTAYPSLPEHLIRYPFRYIFSRKDPKRMAQFRNSPKVNEEVTNFALDNISQLQLGTHDGTDVLSVAYTLAPYEYANSTDNRYEQLDAYYQLDQQLQRLLQSIDKSVGLNNTVVFLAGTPTPDQVPRDNIRFRLPYGEFSTRKAISLLNLYLMALYGNGEWVQAFHNQQFFLNHKLIEEKKLRLSDLREESAAFLKQMSGVKNARSIDEIMDERTAKAATLRANTSLKHAGDVFVEVMPGWQLIDDYATHKRPETDKVFRASAATAPVFILAPHVKSQTIVTPVDARAIAPTVTSLLRIRSPNGAEISPLNLE